jgi:GST-like protein
MMGQANVFFHYLLEKIQSATDRYQRDVTRPFGTLEQQLATHNHIPGDYSIAGTALWPWVLRHDWSGLSVDPFPRLQRWLQPVTSWPAGQAGRDAPIRRDRKAAIDATRKAAPRMLV